MKIIKPYGIKISLWVVIFFGFCVHSHMNAVLRIAIDIPQSLSKSFANVRDYIVNGYGSVHNFGVNRLIMDAINKEKPISSDYSLLEYNYIYLTFMSIDEDEPDKMRMDVIKEALKEAVDKYKVQIQETKFNFKVEKKAFLVSQGPNRLEIFQKVIVNTGGSNLNKLIDLIKESCSKYKITYSTLEELKVDVGVGYAKIKSLDQDLITFLKGNKKIIDHLKTVEPPKGTADGFDTESEIHLYDGLKRLKSYDLKPVMGPTVS